MPLVIFNICQNILHVDADSKKYFRFMFFVFIKSEGLVYASNSI